MVLKSLAKIYFEILWSRHPEGEQVAEKFLDILPKIDFSHSNKIWQLRELKEEDILKFSCLRLN